MGVHSYTLEVTSPGTDRPLTLPRHWRRNQGRLVKVATHDGRARSPVASPTATSSPSPSTWTAPSSHLDLADVAKAKIQVELNKKES